MKRFRPIKNGKGHRVIKRILCLFLVFSLLMAFAPPGMLLYGADEFYFGENTLDTSKGNPGYDWLEAGDERYADYGSPFVLGSAQTPYILKTGDELYGLALKVNAGMSFEGAYINATGLSREEAAGSTNTYTAANVIDLRMYDGSAQSAGYTNLWEPIGKTEQTAFKGHFYSSTNVSIINVCYPYTAALPFAGTVYGLFGYNAGAIGEEGGFQVSAIHIATKKENPQQLDFTANASSVKTIGGVAGVNLTGATVANVTFGTGTNYSLDSGTVVENLVIGNTINLPLNSGSALTAGGIVGCNRGTVTGCTYIGSIYSPGETGTGNGFDQVNGIGGIAGYSTSRIEGCISDANILISTVQALVKVGGVVGALYSLKAHNADALVSSCIFTGSVSVAAPLVTATAKLQNSVGGICGAATNGLIDKCASGGDISFICAGGETGRTGGLIGSALGTTVISASFAAGSVAGGGFTGGLAGALYNSSCIKDSYYTGAVESYGYTFTEESKFGLSANNGVAAAGGLVGSDQAGNANFVSVSNSYFAGSTLNSEIGSLFGASSAAPSDTLYFDCELSPNAAVSTGAVSTHMKSTEFFKTAVISPEFVATGASYPRLNWADCADTSSEFGKLAKALAVVSTAVTLQVTADNSYSNGGDGYGSERNAYQMKKSALDGAALNRQIDGADALGITPSFWSASYTYTGGYDPSETYGALFENTVQISTGRYAVDITLTRKLLAAVNQKDGMACAIENEAQFNRLLDIANFASGAYTGGLFRMAADIGKVTVSSVKDTLDRRRGSSNNYFCSGFDGGGRTIGSIVLENGTQSLFRIGYNAAVSNLNITNIMGGTSENPVEFSEVNTGVLFSKSAYTSFDSVAVDAVSIYGKQIVAGVNFGIFSGIALLGSNCFTNISLRTVDVQVPTTMIGYSYGLISSGVSGADSRIDGISVTENYHLILSNFSTDRSYKNQDKNKAKITGGLFGSVSADATLNNCRINGLYAFIDAYESTANGIFGGIGGQINTNVSNCTVIGKMIGPNGATAFSRVMMGGINADVSVGSKTYTNCHFVGEIDAAVAGGITAYANFSFKFTNCSAIAAINADPTVRSGATKLAAGGITAQNTNTSIVYDTCYFLGNVTAIDAGGLIGTAKNAFTIQNSYAKAIVNSTSSSGTAGGLVGSASGQKMTVNSSYFTGQLSGDGSKGGIAGKAAETSVLNKAYFDRSIAGGAIPAVASITQSNPAVGSALDAKAAKITSEITAAQLSSSFVSETASNYPQLSVFASGSKADQQYSDDSTQKVFLLSNEDATLTGMPNFQLLPGGGAYAVARNESATEVLKPWHEVLGYTPGGEAPFGQYSMKAVGSTLFTVKYNNFLPGKTLDLPYSVRVKPFDYGEGTASDPFIIYNNDELVKFRDYLKNGFDTALQYYKIGSLESGTPSITLDLSEFSDWEPIINLAGHLDGNGSVIKNITCKQGYLKYDDSGIKLLETYYGFFGSTTDTGQVQDLALDGVDIQANNTFNIKAGAFIGQSTGGSYRNIAATNVTMNTGTAATANVGGLVGMVRLDSGRKFDLENSMAYSEISGTGVSGRCGGLIGNCEGMNASVSIMQGASYGTLTGYVNLGGLVGRVSGPELIISRSASTADLNAANGASSYVGGIIGNSETAGINFSLSDCIYGGKMSYDAGFSNALGGLVGGCVVYRDFTGIYIFDSQDDTTFIREGFYASAQELQDDVYMAVSNASDNCYYNANINPYTFGSVVLRGRFSYYNVGGGSTIIDKNYTGELRTVSKGKSSTYDMTSRGLPLGGDWTQESGYYPRPAWLFADTEDTSTQRGEQYINDVSRFYSLALYYTNAGTFGDNGFSNVFVTASDIELDSKAEDGATVKTSNGKMIQSTKEGALTSISVGAAYPSGAFERTVTYQPSVVSCGTADYSFYFANPEGMWVTSETDAGGTAVAYPWTLYTADQIQGLSPLLAAQPDGNGLKIGTLSYAVTPPSDAQLGSTFVLGGDIDCGSAYKSGFKPVCGDGTHAFNTSFNGLGHTISGLYLNASTGDAALGLFADVQGGELSNLGIVSGQVTVDDTVQYASALAAHLGSNASIVNCFSAIPIVAVPSKTKNTVMGALSAHSDGTGSLIKNSFNTGFIFSACAGDTAGGMIGISSNTVIKDCYVAAYIEAENSGTVYGLAANTEVSNCYYDIGACGDMKNTGGAVSKMPTAALLGRGFTAVEGLYPLPSVFANRLSDAVTAAAIPVSLTNARSVTSGEIMYPSAQLYYRNSYAGHAFTGTVGTEGTAYDDQTPFTSFEKIHTGLAMLELAYQGQARPVFMNLQCWYDHGLDSHQFVINTARELAEFAAIVNGTLTAESNPNGQHEHLNLENNSFDGWMVTLGSDIDLSDVGEWNPIGTSSMPFKGHFNGGGHIISNLTIRSADTHGNSALFGTVENASLLNFGVNAGAVSNPEGRAAAVAAHAKGTTIIEKCFSNVSVTAATAAGICAQADGDVRISQCYNMGMLQGTGLIGGIAAQNGGTIENCYNTGVIRSTAAVSAGIAAHNSGRVVSCYNAAYVEGASFSPISAQGAITSCAYDPKLLTYDGQVSGVSKTISFENSTIWTAQETDRYPELNCFKNSDSAAFQDASELSVLKLDFGSGKYLEFVSARCPGQITTDSMSADVLVESPVNIFSVVKNGEIWNVEPSKTGGGYITATVNNASSFSHSYYAVSVMLMKIRYEFDFTKLFDGNPAVNPNYHSNPTSVSTWNENDGTTFILSTPEDLLAFSKYVSDGNSTAGKTFRLEYPIDMAGRSMSPIGTEKTPFMGVFEGGGYMISNLSVTGSGKTALFHTVGSSGKIRNLMLDHFTVSVQKANTAMYAACIAAVNNGTITNVGITNGLLTANNASSNQDTYLGVFAAENMGSIRGCYFIQNRESLYGIVHYSVSNQYVGGMAGNNAGSITGCYLISDMYTANIKAIAGSNGGKTDNIVNCYFNIGGTTWPQNLRYAFDEVSFDNYFVTEPNMKNAEFAKWLSSNIYAGSYKTGTVGAYAGTSDTTLINDGLPYLTCTQLAKYDLGGYFELSNSMMLSIWNVEAGGTSSFLNGVFALDDLDFKYFNSIVTHQLLRFDMSVLPSDIGYEISSRIYGVSADYNNDVTNGVLNSARNNVNDHSSTSDCRAYEITVDSTAVYEPNLIVVTIKLKKVADALPWGVYREWAAP